MTDTTDTTAATTWSLLELDAALRAAWAADTTSPDGSERWSPDNPAWGHCDITALLVNDVFGGDLVLRDRVAAHLGAELPAPA
ncbi:YunG family protein [Streptomyces sp. BH106]|uniref:YunG family protein n=1 Tax=Streptomyces sp. BH106 TaxID=3410409 RepID=UPI003CF33754